VRQRVQQAGGEGAVVVADVGIVERHEPAPSSGQEVAEAEPDVASLARQAGREVAGLQLVADGPQPGSVVPEDPVALGQAGEDGARPVEVGGIGTVQATTTSSR